MRPHEIEIPLMDNCFAGVDPTLRALGNNAHVSRIHVARDGEAALSFPFCREPYQERTGQPLPQFILLDLNLSKADGLSVLGTLKEDRRTRWIPVIVLTSSKEEKEPTASYDLGVNRCIQKAVDFDQFREKVHTLALYWLRVNQPPPRQALTHCMEKSA